MNFIDESLQFGENSKYLQTYLKLMDKHGHETRQQKYMEGHHVFPKFAFGQNSHILYLTFRVHFLAHLLLAKHYKAIKSPLSSKAIYPLMRMSGKYQNQYSPVKYRFTSKIFEIVKRLSSDATSGENNQFYGKKHTPETKARIRAKALNRSPSIDTREKISKRSKKAWANNSERKDELSKRMSERVISQASRDKISKIHSGIRMKEETKEKIRVKAIGRPSPKTQEWCEKISKALTGKKHTEEHINKVNRNPEKIRKTAEKHRGMKRSVETKAKISESRIGQPSFNTNRKAYYDELTKDVIYICDDQPVPIGYVRGDPRMGRKKMKKIHKIDEYEILTDEGFKDFEGLVESRNFTIEIYFSDNSTLKCTLDHKLKLAGDEFIEAKDLTIGQLMSTNISVIGINHCTSKSTVYDLLNVTDTHSYISNNVVSHNCLYLDELAFVSHRIQTAMWRSLAPTLSTGGDAIISSTPNGDVDLFATLWRGANAGKNSFVPLYYPWSVHPDRGEEYLEQMRGELGEIGFRQEVLTEFISSEAMLIDSLKLSYLKAMKPISENMGFRFWVPESKIGGRGKIYMVGIDPATGTGSDFTVITVVEYPAMEQVAELRLNTVNIPLIFAKIKWLFRYLTKPTTTGKAEIMWTFERNGVGEALVAMIQNDDSPDGGVYIDGVDLINEKIDRFGCYTAGKSKLLSLMKLKALIEKGDDGIKIHSDVLLGELQSFVAIGGTYKAKPGATDDAVMSLSLIMKIMERMASYDERVRSIVYEQVAPDQDERENGLEDQFGDEAVPFVF